MFSQRAADLPRSEDNDLHRPLDPPNDPEHLKPSETRHAMWITYVGGGLAVLLGGFAQQRKIQPVATMLIRQGLPATLARHPGASVSASICAPCWAANRSTTSSFSAANTEQVTYSNRPRLQGRPEPSQYSQLLAAKPAMSSGSLRILISGLRLMTPVAEQGTSARMASKGVARSVSGSALASATSGVS
ncbi:MAG: hypothetical protein CM15mP25_1150 [Gammaproteobacteria bacterium]|nr:MAG: hypothetical protein CM15mP25_1150 [Gammaproteobacteria bacterium]